jgi:hypothetical protein
MREVLGVMSGCDESGEKEGKEEIEMHCKI